ncbi:hypothetical protein [Ramlibacter alkalitolerans]|jgi:hypothetical protein|uniref:Uncharacterized protein n=1 Tax=Ramlibacter alkalitolerans TaxID=2039631 RepID=A0ABS1JS46_9BURK|nr:hypothetical protein [Ramlibacter alkalitolerans]MBL0427078.1 hypothetical protein [Ramlibacter alkalitolerans]
MPGTNGTSPIAVRPALRGLDAASQERVALALTLMTKFSFDGAAAERAPTAAAIAQGLHALADDGELTPELRRLCARLQHIWATAGREPM